MSSDDTFEAESFFWRNLLGGVIVIALLGGGLAWCGRANGLFMEKTFAPKEEAVRRTTFEESKAYNQGMVQELQNMQFEYIKADKDQKLALRSIILHRTADYDMDRMPPDLRSFVEQLKQQQGQSEISK